jgi:hypothetical protein
VEHVPTRAVSGNLTWNGHDGQAMIRGTLWVHRSAAIGAAIFITWALGMAAALEAQTPGSDGKPQAPVEKSDDLAYKATVTGYLVDHDQDVDFNLRRRFGPAVAWGGVFLDRHGPGQGRVGAEYDLQREGVLVVPTLNVATNGLVAGSLYAELGHRVYGIAGYAVTNLKPFYNLSFDPNDSVQLGLGWHLSSFDRLVAFCIFDVRLHTGQQDTHLLWRHKLSPRDGITVDSLFKSGRTDEGRYIHAFGLGVYYDRPRTFYKAYWDPYVNFSRHTMLRVGAGVKF